MRSILIYIDQAITGGGSIYRRYFHSPDSYLLFDINDYITIMCNCKHNSVNFLIFRIREWRQKISLRFLLMNFRICRAGITRLRRGFR